MSILKKILAIAIIMGMFGQVSVNSVVGYYQNNEYKERILTYKDGEKYIKLVDNFIGKVSEKKAIILKEKVDKILSSKKRISKKNITILKYIIEKIEEREYLLAEQAKKDIFKNTLSKSDTKKVNEELIKIQKNLLKQGVSSFEKILGELEGYTNFEENGDFEIKGNFDIDSIGKSKIELKLKDYVSRNSGFDSQFKTKIEAIIEAAPKGGEEAKMEVNAFIDYIVKDQNYYVLLKNFKIIDEKSLTEVDSFLEKIKEIASKNKYIKIEDKNTAQIISQLKQFTPDNILKQGSTVVAKPLFTAYKKEGNKFYLIPSKYGCDTVKTLAKKFDPFNGNTCTDSQYQDLLDDIVDTKAEFYIDFSEKNTILGFEVNNKEDIEKVEGDISFSDKYIEKINFIIKPNQENYPGEFASLNFVKAKKLDAKIFAKSGKISLNLKSTLDGANRFKTIDFNYNIDDDFTSKLILKNRKISGKYSGKGYSSKYVGIISGKTDISNKLSILKLSNQYINSSSWNPGETNTILEYSYGKYSINNNYVSEGFISGLNADFNISNNKLISLNFDLEMSQKDSSYDDDYNRIYSGEFNKIVDSKIELKNKNIKGNTIITIDGEEYLKIINTGRYEEDKFELNTKLTLVNKALENFVEGFNSEGGNIDPKEVESNFNIKTDTESNKNNFNIYVDVNIDDKKIIEIELDNKSRKTFKDIEIIAPLPNNTIPLEEVFKNPELY